MDGVRVAPTRGKASIEAWLEFPRQAVYPRTSPWVPPLEDGLRDMLSPRKNPFFHHGTAIPLLARNASGRLVGRVLAHVYHRHNVRHNERVAFFGYFECCNDVAAAGALVRAAAAFGAAHGCTVLRGPFNMTAM